MKTKSSVQGVLMPRRVEHLSAEDFVVLVEENRTNIARSRFVPPRLGSRNFGRFEVEYKIPVLKPA